MVFVPKQSHPSDFSILFVSPQKYSRSIQSNSRVDSLHTSSTIELFAYDDDKFTLQCFYQQSYINHLMNVFLFLHQKKLIFRCPYSNPEILWGLSSVLVNRCNFEHLYRMPFDLWCCIVSGKSAHILMSP